MIKLLENCLNFSWQLEKNDFKNRLFVNCMHKAFLLSLIVIINLWLCVCMKEIYNLYLESEKWDFIYFLGIPCPKLAFQLERNKKSKKIIYICIYYFFYFCHQYYQKTIYNYVNIYFITITLTFNKIFDYEGTWVLVYIWLKQVELLIFRIYWPFLFEKTYACQTFSFITF